MRGMKLLRFAAYIFSFLSIAGGYAWHQYLLFTNSDLYSEWLPQSTQYSIVLGWLLLLLAVALSLAPTEECES